jgi:hypothetical protein
MISINFRRVSFSTVFVISTLVASAARAQPPQPALMLAQQPSVITQPSIRSSNVWKRVLGSVAVPSPWKVAACPGTTPLLCVSYQGKLVGTVEIGAHPLDSRADFKKMLKNAGLPSSSVNIQNPKNRDRIIIALKDWVADYYTFFKQDRKTEYGNELRFATQTPQVLPVGSLTGVSYGFAGVTKAGEVQEQRLGYVAFDGRILYVITTAFDSDASTGSFGKLEDLQRFEPYLKGVIGRLRLPISKR